MLEVFMVRLDKFGTPEEIKNLGPITDDELYAIFFGSLDFNDTPAKYHTFRNLISGKDVKCYFNLTKTDLINYCVFNRTDMNRLKKEVHPEDWELVKGALIKDKLNDYIDLI